MQTMNRAQRRGALRHIQPTGRYNPANYMASKEVFDRIQPFTASELLRLELPIRIAYESIKSGRGVEQDFHDIAAAINAAMVRAESVDPLVEVTAIAARDALMRTWHRYERTGRMGFDGPAIGEVESGVALHEQFCRMSTPLEMIEAMREVIRRGYSKQVVS